MFRCDRVVFRATVTFSGESHICDAVCVVEELAAFPSPASTVYGMLQCFLCIGFFYAGVYQLLLKFASIRPSLALSCSLKHCVRLDSA